MSTAGVHMLARMRVGKYMFTREGEGGLRVRSAESLLCFYSSTHTLHSTKREAKQTALQGGQAALYRQCRRCLLRPCLLCCAGQSPQAPSRRIDEDCQKLYRARPEHRAFLLVRTRTSQAVNGYFEAVHA